MALKVEIDSGAGFCGGVIRAIGTAERFLAAHPSGKLYSLGAIVHNEQELSRLERLGLHRTDSVDNPEIEEGGMLLIRAHGEPTATYVAAARRALGVIDCTCPVVLKLQKDIREASVRVSSAGGQVIIFGKIGHAEVLGLLGHAGGNALVVENLGMLRSMLEEGRIRRDVPIEVFSQTTKDPEQYSQICKELRGSVAGDVTVHRTICRQVASRHRGLEDFARGHDVIVFVTGKESSNGKVLSELCASCNGRCHTVGSWAEIDPQWFRPGDSVGVSGATSTPQWLLEEVAEHIQNLAL
jgi:4-hydroxy-3-methylbut-2-enyl diphosphate reductase